MNTFQPRIYFELKPLIKQATIDICINIQNKMRIYNTYSVLFIDKI